MVIPHTHLEVQDQWFSNPQADPLMLSEPAYDLLL